MYFLQKTAEKQALKVDHVYHFFFNFPIVHCNMEPTHYFSTALKGKTFSPDHTEKLKYQMVAYKLSEKYWVMHLFVIFRFFREKLLVTVALDHHVGGETGSER